ncbi:MAG: MFS transporter [Lentisphaeria bacterium]|nr:MFS transporter [Lentisphaeria bacterium]
MNLFFSKRFLPLFVAQFFGAFNDNFLKNAILIMVIYREMMSKQASDGLANLAAALFLLPYFLFSTLAGELTDKYDRTSCARVCKLIEIPLMCAAVAGFLIPSVPLLLVILFLMGAQSTFFGPAKYALIPALLKKEEIMTGNGWITGGTYLAILLGVVGGSLAISIPRGGILCSGILIVCAALGYIASCSIPMAGNGQEQMVINWNIPVRTYRILKNDVWGQYPVRFCVLSCSMFLLAGSLILTQIPSLTKNHLGGGEKVCTAFFLIFSIGIGIGSGLARRIYRTGHINLSRRVLLFNFLMALFVLGLSRYALKHENVYDFCGNLPGSLLLPLELFLLAVCGGLWLVPLHTHIQATSRPEVLGRVIAGKNILESACAASGSLLIAFLLNKGLPLYCVFPVISVIICLGGLFLLPVILRKNPAGN